MLKADGFDEAIIGMSSDIATSGERLIYDANKCIDILIRDHDMSEAEAIEYFEFNVSGAYVGENTPIWLYPYEDL
jgi:hypothetical protein